MRPQREPIVEAAPAGHALTRALTQLAAVQRPEGAWEGEMVWNSMILSQWIIVQHVTGRIGRITPTTRARILRQYETTQTASGGWPMHGEGDAYVFMTTLAYVALRLIGVGADEPLCARARRFLHAQPGGVLAVPTWGKLWLAFLGLYEYEGVNPIPPELFLLPSTLPIHPDNFYCHTRYIYLGLAYLYGRRFQHDLGTLGYDLRSELFAQPYSQIDWPAQRHELAASDLHVRPSAALRAAYDALGQYERLPWKPLRKRALAHCLSRIVFEQEATRGQGLSPVNGLLNCLALHVEGHPLLDSSLAAMESWKWEDEAEGIRYCGAHSTSWDTAFALRALTEAPAAQQALTPVAAALARGYDWLRDAQMHDELDGGAAEAREPIVGGWCFSDGVHRWPVSDCTAEALTALVEAHAHAPLPAQPIRDSDLIAAARFILRRQNPDGGFGSYEARRGSLVLEHVNPSEMYGNCMTERSYTECTASCLGALARFRRVFPALMRRQIDAAIERAIELLRSRQLEDGSYAGFWGVNYTYAIFHVVEALVAAGLPANDPAIARAIAWLLRTQKSDGGWGEHWSSCVRERYVEHPESQAAMTAWALLALLETLPPTHPAIVRAVGCLTALQLPDGSWPKQSQSGVFFTTAMLDYRLYKDIFPSWALARHARLTAS